MSLYNSVETLEISSYYYPKNFLIVGTLLSFFFLFLFSVPLVSALTWNVDFTTVTVNNTIYWDSHPFSYLDDIYYNQSEIDNILTTNLTNYVPYIGATDDLDLGVYDFWARYGNFTVDLEVTDDLFVYDDSFFYDDVDIFGRLKVYDEISHFFGDVHLENDSSIELQIETTNSSESAELQLLADGTNDLYIYTYGSTAAATYYGLPRANTSYIDARGERFVLGTFDSSPMYLATSQDPRFILTATGNLIPFDDEDYDIGNSSNRLRDLYIKGEENYGIHFVEDDGITIGNLSMDDDLNLLWNGEVIGNTSFNYTLISNDFVPYTNANYSALTDNSMADTLHRHSELSASDGTPDRALVVDASGNVGIGTTGPDARFHVVSTIPIMAKFVNTQTSGSGSGAGMIGYSDDGAAIGSGDRLGLFLLGGAKDASHTLLASAGMTAFASEAWSSTVSGTDLRFETVANGGISRTAKMVITNAGNVGIGTTNPTYKLDVNPASGFTGDLLRVASSTIAANVFVVKSSGNVGIGTTGPDARFHVVSTIPIMAKFVNTQTSGSGSGAGMIGYSDDGAAIGSGDRLGLFLLGGAKDASHTLLASAGMTAFASEAWSSTVSGTDLRFETVANGGISRTAKMVITNAGNVGIGTTGPNYKLEIADVDKALNVSNVLFVNGTSGNVGIGTFSPQNTLNVVGDLNVTGTIYANAINISNSSFSFTHNENDSISFSIQNENNGSNATSLIRTLNDVGGIFGIGIASSNCLLGNMLMPNMTALFSRSQGEMAFINAFNRAFVWYVNPSDDNDVNNLVEIMRLDENGLNLSRNLTANQYYGEMWFHNDSASGNPTIISSQDVWYNITGFNQTGDSGQSLNGFSYSQHKLTCNIAGLYKIDYSISFGGGLNDEYKTAVGVNGIKQGNTETHRKLGAGGDVGNTGSSGFVSLSVDDEITLMILNDDATANADVHSANINLVRIG